jgi:hypothetical protein
VKKIHYNNTYHLTPYAPHLSSLADITFFYQPEIPVTKNFVLAPLTSSVLDDERSGENRKEGGASYVFRHVSKTCGWCQLRMMLEVLRQHY